MSPSADSPASEAVSQVTCHVLDAVAGRPAVGVAVLLRGPSGDVLGDGRTDADGRIRRLGPPRLEVGDHRVEFATGSWFGATPTFYPEVVVTIRVDDPAQHYHVPLLLSPFGYSTYRGS